MRTFLWVVVAGQAVTLLYFMALRLDRYRFSRFVLRSELAHKADAKSRMLKKINRYVHEISVLRSIDRAILLLLLTGFLVYQEQSLVGIIYTSIVVVVLWLIARISVVKKAATHIFEKHYEFVCQLTKQLGPLLRFIQPAVQAESIPHSKTELIDVVQTLPSTVLLPIERQRVEAILSANLKSVKDIMTPKKRVVTIEPSATLGPIVLSDLQKSGHGYFPVVTKKGEPEGVLTLSDTIDLELAKQRSTIRELMTVHVSWVEEDTSLTELAQAIIEEKQYILLVRDSNGNFSGVVTISDLMKHLVGIVKD